MRALIAFDKFKDSLTAHQTCEIAAATVNKRHPDWTIQTAPLADGGDGFCDVLTLQAKGEFFTQEVIGPQGAPANAKIGIVSLDNLQDSAIELLEFGPEVQRIAIVEMAQSSGIALVPQEKRSPWEATTAGLGQLIELAEKQGAHACIIGLGGSATHDLAIGALWQLGFELKDAAGNPLPHIPYPKTWKNIHAIECPKKSTSMEIRIACDVENPLLGLQGAAAIFGPQKGLIASDFQNLENETERVARLVLQATRRDETSLSTPGTGAAGGAAFGLMLGLSGKIVPGFNLVKAWIGLDPKLAQADLVITGEGRFDASSLQGKGPGSLIKEANTLQKKSYVFAGSLGDLDTATIPFTELIAISPPSLDLATALEQTEANLVRALQSRIQ